jgi:hypothetical protein
MKGAHQNIAMSVGLTFPGAKYKLSILAAACDLPFSQRVQQTISKWNGSVPGFRLRAADLTVSVGPLHDMQLPLLEIDVLPVETTQLTRAQSAKDRCQ